jgi:predicted AAA+ superfamily ATPase
LVSSELNEDFDLEKSMYTGTLPSHYFSDLPNEDLKSYIGLYLTEEIAAEGISRNIPAFARFLEVAATCNTQMLNFTSIGSDAQIARQTVQNYFQVLVDTLLGFYLPPFQKTKKRKSIGTSKFYFFDMGVVRSLRSLEKITKTSKDYGEFFEHFIFLELRAFVSYMHPDLELQYWRSLSGFEVDFILGKHLAIEVKASSNISTGHLRGLKALAEEHKCEFSIVVCSEKTKRFVDGIWIYPWSVFLEELWAGKFF